MTGQLRLKSLNLNGMPDNLTIRFDESTTLMWQVTKDDHLSFKMLYEKYLRVIMNYMRRNGCPEASAEDLAHDVFLRLWQHRKKFQGKSIFLTFLFGYAKNVLHEKKSAMSDIIALNDCDVSNFVSKLSSPDTIAQHKDIARCFGKAIFNLTQKQRLAFEAVYLNALSVTEAAELLGCSPASIYNHLHRARKHMRELLKNLQK